MTSISKLFQFWFSKNANTQPQRSRGRTRVRDAHDEGGDDRDGVRVGHDGVRDACEERGAQDPVHVAADAVHREARDRTHDRCMHKHAN